MSDQQPAPPAYNTSRFRPSDYNFEMFVGPRAVRSWPAIAGGGAPEDFPGDMLATVVDDDLRQIAPEPFEAKGALAAYARDLEPGTVDWAAARELDNDAMSELLADDEPSVDPHAFRYARFAENDLAPMPTLRH